MLFFPAASFLNIGLLLHTKETVLVILVKLDYMTIRPFPSHDFYNKNTAVLSDGSVSRSLESTFPTSTEFFLGLIVIEDSRLLDLTVNNVDMNFNISVLRLFWE